MVPRAVAQPLDTQTRRRFAEAYFDKARGFDPKNGEGDMAWLYLLAARSMDIEVGVGALWLFFFTICLKLCVV